MTAEEIKEFCLERLMWNEKLWDHYNDGKHVDVLMSLYGENRFINHLIEEMEKEQ